MISKRFHVGTEKLIHADWWDEGETVTIRRLTWLDVQEIFGQAADVKAGDGSKTTIDFNIAAYQFEMLRRGIKSWNLLGADGLPVPLTKEFLGMLSSEDGNYILEQITAYNPDVNRNAEEAGFRPQ